MIEVLKECWLLFEINQIQPLSIPNGIKEAFTFSPIFIKIQQIVHQEKIVIAVLNGFKWIDYHKNCKNYQFFVTSFSQVPVSWTKD